MPGELNEVIPKRALSCAEYNFETEFLICFPSLTTLAAHSSIRSATAPSSSLPGIGYDIRDGLQSKKIKLRVVYTG